MKYFFAFILTICSLLVISQKGLELNTQAPNFKGVNQNGKLVDSKDILKDSSIVLIFYRGKWCPYCERHLSTLQDSIPLIQNKGAKVVVVSPEKPESSAQIISKTNASYDVVYDSNYIIMKQFEVAYKISKETVPKYRFFVKRATRKANGNKEDMLPVPATYVINKSGKIVYKHYDKDYTTRSTVKAILKHI